MKTWIQLLRPVNLLLLVLTQYCIDWFILQPNFLKYGLPFTLNEFQFFLLVLATALICAGGYVINDYFDVQIDAVNKPDKQIIGKKIAPEKAFNFYLILTVIGLGLGVYLSLAIDYWKLVTIFVVVIALLYLYSIAFKRMVFIGNFIVALLSAISVIIVMLFEPSLYNLARPGDYYIAGLCTKYIMGISFFAFALTVVREIVKDIQDIEGDRKYNAKTLPVKYGARRTVLIAELFLLVTFGGLLYLNFTVFNIFGNIYLIYILVLVAFLLFIGFRLFNAGTKKEYGVISTLLKISMVVGLGLMPLYYLLEF